MPKYKYTGKQEVNPFGVKVNEGDTVDLPQEINHPSFVLVEAKKKSTKKEDKE